MTVSILMALYNPQMDWLKEQLLSIENQTYRKIEVLAKDDCSSQIPFAQIEKLFSDCLINTPYTLFQNDINQGSNLTFAQLTEQATGDCISYCDQDDIWHLQKTEILLNKLQQSNAKLVYSDLSVMDGNGNHIADSLRDSRRRLQHLQGDGLAEGLLFRNFTNGTAMLMHTATAKAALPFVSDMVADHWLTLYAATQGLIVFVPQPLVRYRIHGHNQSAVMSGVVDKQSYLNGRIRVGLSRFAQYKERVFYADSLCLKYNQQDLTKTIQDGLRWFQAREHWFAQSKQAITVWRYRHLGRQVSLFELVAARLPNALFCWLVRLVQQGLL